MPGTTALVAVDDPQLRSSLERLAAAAGVTVTVTSPAELPSSWSAAHAVLVDPAAAQVCAAAGLARRPGVVVVVGGDVPATAWPVAVAVGAEAVFGLPCQEDVVVGWLATVGEPVAAARVVCCRPARGGAGASTLAAALALVAGSRGQDVLLLDGDPGGGGLDYLLGAEDVAGIRWEDLAETAGVLGAAALTEALPRVGGIRLLSFSAATRRPPPQAALDAVLSAATRGHDLVVADLPAASGRAATSLAARAHAVVVVAPAEVRAVAAATAIVAEQVASRTQVRLVVRQPGPAGLRPRDVADAVGRPVSAVWPWERRLGAVVDRGRFSRDWRRTAASRVAARLLDDASEVAA